MPGRHPGCRMCPNKGTDKCHCKTDATTCSSNTANPDLVAEITRRVMAQLNK